MEQLTEEQLDEPTDDTSGEAGAPAAATRLVRWEDFEGAEPELAAAVRARFEAFRHHVLATLRRDGAPRVAGTEVAIHHGDLTIGSMWRSAKALDLLRDGHYALHSNPGDGSMEGGDSKVAGVAVEMTGAARDRYVEEVDPPTPFHLFRLDVAQVVHSTIHPDGDRMVIHSWRPGRGVTRVERR